MASCSNATSHSCGSRISKQRESKRPAAPHAWPEPSEHGMTLSAARQHRCPDVGHGAVGSKRTRKRCVPVSPTHRSSACSRAANRLVAGWAFSHPAGAPWAASGAVKSNSAAHVNRTVRVAPSRELRGDMVLPSVAPQRISSWQDRLKSAGGTSVEGVNFGFRPMPRTTLARAPLRLGVNCARCAAKRLCDRRPRTTVASPSTDGCRTRRCVATG